MNIVVPPDEFTSRNICREAMIEILEDQVVEFNESFSVNISSSDYAVVIVNGTSTVLIEDTSGMYCVISYEQLTLS